MVPRLVTLKAGFMNLYWQSQTYPAGKIGYPILVLGKPTLKVREYLPTAQGKSICTADTAVGE